MKYEVRFPTTSIEKKFGKELSKIHPTKLQEKIMEEVEKLSLNPRPFGLKAFKKLEIPTRFYEYTAQ